MILLGLDPGSAESALVAFDPERRRPVRFAKRVNAELPELLELYRDELGARLVVIEQTKGYTVPGGRDARFVPEQLLQTCEWIGYFRRVAETLELEVAKIDRRTVKLELLGRASGTDAQVREALVDLIGPPGRKAAPGPTYGVRSDMWAALAVAFVYAERARRAGAPARRSTIEVSRDSPARVEEDRAF